MKSEPDSRIVDGKDVKFSITDLENAKEPEPWTGVRNYAARNNMQAMKKGELALFYHSNTKVPGVAGIMEIVEEATIDKTAFDPENPYYDPKSKREKPAWYCVSVTFRERFPRIISLHELRKHDTLSRMELFSKARLSVSRVTAEEFHFIASLKDMEDEVIDYFPQT
ncbi:DUF55-domain-containing protein [Patellaria atrata CBS 101060]|uniref:Thymocyte nuclear protein 1 n=1 Tax=Patellaria atrata CBS 101060 TaxID=1346257 RepID=A0A9P4S6N2_9PEZI|nr:DUF55-domain-containing protein [Patellaria atrata CBS 101060]